MKIARALGNILRGQSSPIDSLSLTQKENIDLFEKQLNQIHNVQDITQKLDIYLQLSSNFTSTFSILNQEQVKYERISTIYTNYVILTLNLYADVFDHYPMKYADIFNSLSLIGSQTGTLPYPDNRFVEFYYLIIRTAKNGDIHCLTLSNEFSTYLFKNKTFFDEFLSTDGLLLIFTSFFIPNNTECIAIMLKILFTIVPIEFYTSPCETTLLICRNSLKPENCPECAIFLCTLLARLAFNLGDSVFADFAETGGFYSLNDFLINYADSRSTLRCYSPLLFSKHNPAFPSIYAIKSLYDLYSKTDKFDDLVFNLLIELQPKSLQQFSPIDHWIFPKTTIPQVELLAIYIQRVGFKDGVDHLFSIILDRPELEIILFNLISSCLPSSAFSEMKYNPTLENQIRFFLYQLDSEHLIHYLTSTSFDSILSYAYKHPFNNTIRKDLISKIISVYNNQLIGLMNQMLSVDMNCDIYQLFVDNLENSDICDLFVKIIENGYCQYYLKYFIACNGFKKFDSIISNNSQNIIKVIKVLTINGQNNEIDNWILNLNNDSPLFDDKNIELLSEAAVNPETKFLNVPSLLLFNFIFNHEKVTFDVSSPVCLFNAGKFGLKMFIQRKMDIKKLACLDLIVNRYCDHSIYHQIEDDYVNYSKYIQNVDHISSKKEASFTNIELFELYNSGHSTSNPILCLSDDSKQIKHISFRFFVPKTYQKVQNIPIFRCDGLEINYLHGSLLFKSNIDKKEIEIDINEFVKINIEFVQMAIKIAINSNQIISIKSDIIPPTVIFFGGSFEFNSSGNILRLFVDRYILINHNLSLFEELSEGVFKVPLVNFHSFIMSDRIRVESIYQKLEAQKNDNDNFMQLFNSILYIIKSQISTLRSVHNISKDNLITRLTKSLKQSSELIDPQCLLYFYQLPYSILDEDDFAAFFTKILDDYELYFIFPNNSILSLLKQTQSILDDSPYLVDKFIENKMVSHFLSIIQHTEHKTGFSKEILLIIKKLLIQIGNDKKYQNDDSLNIFISKAVTCSYLQKDLIKYNELDSSKGLFDLSKEIYEKECEQLDLTFFDFLKKILKKIKTEKLTLSELLTISGYFDDERTIYMFKILNEYSYRNPNYITNDKVNLLIRSFTKFIEKEEIWLIILSILFANQKIMKEFQPMKIERPKFLPVVLFLLSELISKECLFIINNKMSKYKDLLHKLLTVFLQIQYNEISINPIYLLLLSNLGIIPKSIELSFDDTRTQVIFPYDKIKLKSIDLSEFEIPNEFLDYSIEKFPIPEFPDDVIDLDFLTEIEFDLIIELISKLLIASNLNDLKLIIVGNALMYTNYQKLFVQKLIYNLLEKVNKNILGIVLQAVRGSIFIDSDYSKLLQLIFLYVKRTNLFTKELRTLIILSFTFITNENEVEVRNALIKDNLDIVLNQQLNEDTDYIDIVHVCGAIDANYQPHITHQMIAIKLSEMDSLISKHFDISERFILQSQSEVPLSIQIHNIDAHTVRISNAKKLLEFYLNVNEQFSKQNLYNKASFLSLLTKENMNKYEYLELYERIMEQWHFRFVKMSYKLNQNYEYNSSKFALNSFYLSENTFPYYSPRNMFPSPFSIKCPPNDGSQQEKESFQLEKLKSNLYQFPTGWCQDNNIYKYSHVFNAKFDINSKILKEFVRIYGMFTNFYEIDLFYYVHSIPSLLFVYSNRIVILILANKANMLLKEYDNPILLIPLSQQIILSEFHESTLFCGHYVINLSDDRFVSCDDHYYMHKKRSLSLFYMYDPNIVLIFKSIEEMNEFKKNKFTQIEKVANNPQIYKNSDFNLNSKNGYNLNLNLNTFNYNQIELFKSDSKPPPILAYSFTQSLPEQSFFFQNSPTYRIVLYWLENVLSSFDYLVFLNLFAGRSFTDIGQYPVFPWVANPENCTKRDLSKPLGQINPEKAKHYDEYYEIQNYYYGVHYSHQAAICYYLARVPPFNYLWWNFNKGWDNPARFFSSITAAYEEVINENTGDLKEEIPELFSIPEILQNDSNLNCIPSNVKLPSIRIATSLFTQEDQSMSINETNNEQNQVQCDSNQIQSNDSNQNEDENNEKDQNQSNDNDHNESQSTENDQNQQDNQDKNDTNQGSQNDNQQNEADQNNENIETNQSTENNLIQDESGFSCSPPMFISINRKLLEQSTDLNHWIDLIFGYKQTGDEAKSSKNVFHPASYHNSTAESTNMKQNEFEDHVTFFGQCPEQKFVLRHPPRRAHQIRIKSFEKVNLDCLKDISKLFFEFTINSEQKKPAKSPRTRKFSLARIKEVESSLFKPTYSIYMSMNQNEKYFLTTGIDWNSAFIEFDNELHRISGRIHLKWKLINGNGIIIPFNSILLKNNNLSDYINLSAINPQAILTPSSPLYLTKTKSVHVLSIENHEFITIRKIDNSNIQTIKSIQDESVDQNSFSVKENFTSTSELLVLFKDEHSSFLNHMSCSSDGLLICCSYTCGLIKFFRVDYEKTVPRQIKLIRAISQNDEIISTAISSRDMLCFALCKSLKLSIFSLANGLKVREFDLSTYNDQLIDVIYDDFDGVISVLMSNHIVQFYSNGLNKLREISFDNDVKLSCFALLDFDFQFDKRFLIVGDDHGSVYIIGVQCPICELNDHHLQATISNDQQNPLIMNEENNGKLVILDVKKEFVPSKVSSIYDDKNYRLIIANDEIGNSSIMHIKEWQRENKIVPRCEKCLFEMDSRCANCGSPICSTCNSTEFCYTCVENNFGILMK